MDQLIDKTTHVLELAEELERNDAMKLYPSASLSTLIHRLDGALAHLQNAERYGSYISGDQPTRIEKARNEIDSAMEHSSILDLDVKDNYKNTAKKIGDIVTDLYGDLKTEARKESRCASCKRKLHERPR